MHIYRCDLCGDETDKPYALRGYGLGYAKRNYHLCVTCLPKLDKLFSGESDEPDRDFLAEVTIKTAEGTVIHKAVYNTRQNGAYDCYGYSNFGGYRISFK